MIWNLLWLLLAIPTAAALFFSARLFVFLLASFMKPVKEMTSGKNETRFLVLIPAHNEEKYIHLSVESVLQQTYPAEQIQLVLLADNCSDQTAKLARELGAEVEERVEPDLHGKHHAIRWFLSRRNPATYDALVILDADTKMQPDYLQVLDARFEQGAIAAQGFNGVLNPDDTMLTRLTLVTNTMKNRLYYQGKSALGLSVPLMNGMAISSDVLVREGFQAQSVAEDFETYLRLAGEGVRVHYACQTRVLSLKATSFDEAYDQRLRWSSGQSQVTRQLVPELIARAVKHKSVMLFDAALDLASPGYAPLTGVHVILLAAALLVPQTAVGSVILWGLLFSLATLMLNFIAGLLFAGPTPKRIASVLLVPVFILWKGAIAIRGAIGKGPRSWVRGAR